jgi:hypothetical protein
MIDDDNGKLHLEKRGVMAVTYVRKKKNEELLLLGSFCRHSKNYEILQLALWLGTTST